MQLVIPEPVLNLTEFICESDAIEGIRDDRDLVIRQIRSRHPEGHVGTMLLLEQLVQSPLNQGGYLTKELICKVQGLITAEQHLKSGGKRLKRQFVGQYRSGWVRVAKRVCPPPYNVPKLVDKLLQKINWWQSNSRFSGWDQNVRHLASFHLKFLDIHPFADGNGRTGRALVYYLMRWAGLKPIVFTDRDKHQLYYPCFDDMDNPDAMEKYFLLKMGIISADS